MRRNGIALILFAALPLLGAAGALAVSVARSHPPVSPVHPSGVMREVLPAESEAEIRTQPLESDTFGLLLCGIDNTRSLADVILYARLDTAHQKADLLQIPRDLFVGTQYATGKINAACLPFESADPTRRIKAIIESQFDLPVDGCAAITLAGVRALVDAVGGVTVDLPREIDYLPGKTLAAGRQTLTGEQAEWLLRYRKDYKMADLDRLQAQQQFLSAAFDAAKGLGQMQALRIAAQNFGHVKTDLPLSVVSSLLSEGMKLTAQNVEMRVVPAYGGRYHGFSVLCADRYRLAEMLNEDFRPTADPISPWGLSLQYPPTDAQDAAQVPSVPAPTADGPFDFSWNPPPDADGEANVFDD